MEGFSLKGFLFSYVETYVHEVDVEGMIGVKRKKYNFSKRKQKEIMSLNFASRIETVLSKESYRGVKVTMCCSLNYCQHFPHEVT
jgi:hypothetical protein